MRFLAQWYTGDSLPTTDSERHCNIVHLERHRAPQENTCTKEERCRYLLQQEKVFVYFTVGPPKFKTPLLSITPPRRLGRPNQYPNLDRLGRASPPIPLLWSNSTNFRKRPTSGRFRRPDPRRVAKTPHGYIIIVVKLIFLWTIFFVSGKNI